VAPPDIAEWMALRRARWLAAGYTLAEIALMSRLSRPDVHPAPGKRGPRVKWTSERNHELLMLVGKRPRRLSVSRYCFVLAKCEPWATLVRGRRDPGKVLREHYERLWMGCADVFVNEAGEALRVVRPPKRKRR
jgi:hypothetical protein